MAGQLTSLIRRPNLLSYPGTAPGFDPSHIAAYATDFSAIPSTANFINLMNGAKGAPVSPVAITDKADAILGRTSLMATSTSAGILFSGYSTVNDTSSTIAAIVRFTTVNANQYIFANNNNLKGNALNVNSGTLQWTMFGVVAASSGLTLTAGVPYFIVASQNASVVINYLVLRLDTGKIVTATSASNAGGTPLDGNYTISPNFNSTTTQGNIAAVMHSKKYHSLNDLRIWAQDPWSFWYPDNTIDASMLTVAAGGGASFLAAWARNSNLPVIGTGNY